MRESCAGCKFWVGDEDVPELGHCLRYPPVLGTVLPPNPDALADVTFIYPVTRAYAWCGEWQPKPDPDREEQDDVETWRNRGISPGQKNRR